MSNPSDEEYDDGSGEDSPIDGLESLIGKVAEIGRLKSRLDSSSEIDSEELVDLMNKHFDLPPELWMRAGASRERVSDLFVGGTSILGAVFAVAGFSITACTAVGLADIEEGNEAYGCIFGVEEIPGFLRDVATAMDRRLAAAKVKGGGE